MATKQAFNCSEMILAPSFNLVELWDNHIRTKHRKLICGKFWQSRLMLPHALVKSSGDYYTIRWVNLTNQPVILSACPLTNMTSVANLTQKWLVADQLALRWKRDVLSCDVMLYFSSLVSINLSFYQLVFLPSSPLTSMTSSTFPLWLIWP